MPIPYSLDLRKKIIETLQETNQTISSTAKSFRVSYDFVSQLWKKYKATGNIAPKKVGGCTKPKVTKDGEAQIKIWLKEKPSLTLNELCQQYEQTFQIKMGKSSMDRALKRAKITFKKKSPYDPKKNLEQNQKLTVEYCEQIKNIPQARLVFIDEMGANLDQTLAYGRATTNERAYAEKPTNKGKRVSLVGALTEDGIKTALNFEGTMTGAVFLYFIENYLCPILKAGDYVVMDNASVHKVKGVKELIEKVGAKVIYLPPYSPELNPIELAWNTIKQFLRKQQARTVDNLYQAYADALKAISTIDSKLFINHSMKFVS